MRKFMAVGIGIVVLLGALASTLSPSLREWLGIVSSAEPPGRGAIDATQRAVPVPTAVAAKEDFPIRRSASGFVSSPAVVNVDARVASQVVEVAVKDGQAVKAGDLLFRLDDRALQAQLARDQAGLAKDQASLVGAQGDLARARDLLAKGVGTQQAYDEQLAVTQGFEAALQADRAAIEADKVQLGFATITAPIAGVLGEVATTVGDIVGTGGGAQAAQPLVTITQMHPLQVTFNLPEADLPLLRKAMAAPQSGTVRLSLPGVKDAAATGTLDFVDSSVDTTTGTIAARASIPNDDGQLWPGQYVMVEVVLGTLAGSVSVPTVAIQQGQQGAFVYVVDADGKARMRPVTVALADGAKSAVGAGLSAGEKVVVEGQGRLKDGAAVREEHPEARAAPAAASKLTQ